jgi:hypothetical protein
MFNDRDLIILGAGAFLAVLCLLLPLPFAGKIIFGFIVLVAFMALALIRMGPDRVTLEEWMRRRIRFSRRARRFTYHTAPPPQAPVSVVPVAQVQQTIKPSIPITPEPVQYPKLYPLPVSFDLGKYSVYPLMTVFLIVVGIYFVVWLAQGGQQELAQLLEGLW